MFFYSFYSDIQLHYAMPHHANIYFICIDCHSFIRVSGGISKNLKVLDTEQLKKEQQTGLQKKI